MLAIAAAVAIMVAFFLVANRTVARRQSYTDTIRAQKHTDQVICARVNRIYVAIQDQVRKSMMDTKKISYYQNPAHAADLKAVEDNLRDELVAFAPLPCPK